MLVPLLAFAVPATAVSAARGIDPRRPGTTAGHAGAPTSAVGPVAPATTATPFSPVPTPSRAGSPRASAASSRSTESLAVSYASQVVTLVNHRRTAAGCRPLRIDDRLAAAALGHSRDMAVRDYFDHSTPNGVTPWTRIEKHGYNQPSAENIAAGQPTPDAVVAAWMESSAHRANILNCASHATGVGFYRGGSYRYYWTEDFGYV